MTIRHRGRVLGIAAMLALSIASLGAVPVAASSTTRWVDLDGHAGPSSCSGSAAAATTVQDAIDAARAGDTILVCPGTYVGPVTVTRNHLTLKSVKPAEAILALPAGGGSFLVDVEGRKGFSLRGFRLVNTPGAGCSQISVAVFIQDSTGVTVRGNRIEARGKHTLSGCGVEYGVVVYSPGSKASSAYVAFNIVRDFSIAGVEVNGTKAHATVERNSFQFLHANEAATGSESAGVSIIEGATVIARRNAVYSGPHAGTASSRTPLLAWGIHASHAGTGTRILDNTVRLAAIGIGIESTTGGLVADNSVRSAFVAGLGLNTVSGLTAQDNTLGHGRANAVGVFLVDSDGNTIRRNDARGNGGLDCTDDSSGSGTAGTDNTWTADLGVDADPSGICSAP